VNKDGVIYARGARDDKPHVVAGIMILLLLKRMNIQLDRDVIFLAEAGEEGTSTFGIDYMVKEHWPEIESEYAIAEGGSIVEENGKPHHILISNTEKSPQRIRLVAHGPAGHGSRPEMANAVVHLAQAVERAGNWQTPMRLGDTTRAYFERLAAISPPQSASRYRDILNPIHAVEVDRYFRRKRTRPLLHPADLGSSHHRQYRIPFERHPFRRRSHARRARPARRRHGEIRCRTAPRD